LLAAGLIIIATGFLRALVAAWLLLTARSTRLVLANIAGPLAGLATLLAGRRARLVVMLAGRGAARPLLAWLAANLLLARLAAFSVLVARGTRLLALIALIALVAAAAAVMAMTTARAAFPLLAWLAANFLLTWLAALSMFAAGGTRLLALIAATGLLAALRTAVLLRTATRILMTLFTASAVAPREPAAAAALLTARLATALTRRLTIRRSGRSRRADQHLIVHASRHECRGQEPDGKAHVSLLLLPVGAANVRKKRRQQRVRVKRPLAAQNYSSVTLCYLSFLSAVACLVHLVHLVGQRAMPSLTTLPLLLTVPRTPEPNIPRRSVMDCRSRNSGND
jgi:hypothetical protein